MFFSPSLNDIISAMNRKNYILYQGSGRSTRNLNIVGIRRKNITPGKFDDTIAIFYLIPGAYDLIMFPITTDPSPFYLKKPSNISGTAILKEGQYVDTYAIDTHRPPSGKNHLALCQRLGKVTVWRDNSKDGKMNFQNPDFGMHGINIHRGPKNGKWNDPDPNYSAGCQVFADRDDFSIFMKRCGKEKIETNSNVFTYTLLNEADF